ncbi:MAG: Gfo/Idh/MocA family oxidoreductase [Arenicellales bacterium]|nr:Gfo/Idh/MocA family oxidoreductase [Arenicellales bacterium]
MTDRLRVATIGAGYFSQFHYDAWSRLDVDLVALCERDPQAARRTADEYTIPSVYHTVEAMLEAERPDLVDIITPPPTHLNFIQILTESKVATVCQKPFTENLDQALQAVDAGERARTLIVVHENFRFQPWYGQIKKMLEEGVVGEPYQVTFRLRPGDGQGERAYLDRQPYFQEMPRLLIHETAIHLIDVFRYLFGEVDHVFAQLVRLNPVIKGEDAGLILFTFQNGRRGLFDGNRLVDHPARNRRLTMGEMLLEGSAATIRLDGNGDLFLREHGQNEESSVAYKWQDRGFGGDSVFRFQRHVVEHLINGKPIYNTARDYLNNIKIEQAIYASNESGTKVEISG